MDFDLIDILLGSGILGTLATLYAKYRYDKKKIPLDRTQVQAAAAEQNVTAALAISAEYKEQLRVTRESFKEDTKQLRLRGQEDMAAMERRHNNDMECMRERMARCESQNEELGRALAALRVSESQKDEKIGRLERSLHAAQRIITELLEHITHISPDPESVPKPDLSIFD